MFSRRTVAAATCAAVSLGAFLATLSVSSRAHAQNVAAAAGGRAAQLQQPQAGFTERFRFQAGVTRETRKTADTTDFLLGATPEIQWLMLEPGWLLRATYSLTGTVHTNQSSDVANRLALAVTAEPSRRMTVGLSAEATQSTISTSFLTSSAAQAPVNGVLAATDTQILTVGSGQTMGYEISPVVRFGQSAGITYSRALDSDTGLDNFAANASLALDRVWKADSLGIEGRATFASTKPAATAIVPTPPRQKLFAVTPAPRWRHDISSTLSSSVDAGPTFVFSPDPSTKTQVSVSGRGSLNYFWSPATIELSYQHSFEPNTITGQVLRSHIGTLRGTTPISTENHIVGTASVGYLHGTFVNLRTDAVPRDDFDTFVGDIEIGWLPYDWLQPFLRYQFLTQDGGASAIDDPSFVRHAVLLGVQLTTAPAGTFTAAARPQRVDRADAPVSP